MACGMPILMQGYNNEDIAAGIDEHMIRQPLGVVAAITPFNFPGMIPFWFLPYAVACGKLLPAEAVRARAADVVELFHLIEAAGFPPGVVQLVNGGREAVDAILDHPEIRAVSFVGSTAGRALHLQPRRGQRQARAVPGRREESGRHPAGRRHGNDHQDPGRFRVRLRRAALPGGVGRHHGRRRAPGA